MRDLKNNLTSGKNTKNIQSGKGKSFGYQVLGFGAGGGRGPYIITYLIAAGGAGGSGQSGGSGGAGGLITTTLTVEPDAAYTVTIGAGSAGNPNKAGNGSPSAFGAVPTTGGGAGGWSSSRAGNPGGSGGGSSDSSPYGPPGSGIPGQGNPGGSQSGSGGKNSAGSVTNGGAGYPSSISGSPVTYSAGGQGNGHGGGGPGGSGSGGTNTGTGGGGRHAASNSNSGGPGIVIVSYAGAQVGLGGNSITESGGNTIHKFTGPGTYTA